METIKIMGGYVELHPFVTRRISRGYSEILGKTANVNSEGAQIVTSEGVNKASEYMVLEMVKRAVVVSEDGTEHEQKVDSDWLDELAERDFRNISDAVQKLFEEARGKAKKV